MNITSINYGGEAIKALGDGWIYGPLVRYGDKDNPDLEGEFFTRSTDFGKSWPSEAPVYFEHGKDRVLGVKSLGRAELSENEFGIWARMWLDRSDRYKSFLYHMAEEGKLGWSSASSAHLARGASAGKSVMITSWPIVEATLTVGPCDPACLVTPVKSFVERLEKAESPFKSVSGSSSLPLADRNTKWDASAATKRIKSWAGADEKPNAKFRSAFFWYDESKPDEFGSYKLPFADVIGGALKAVPKGVFAVAGVLEGSRGGVSIPDEDKSKIKSKVAGYYRKMSKTFDDKDIKVPWAAKSLYFGEEIEEEMVHAAAYRLNCAYMNSVCDITEDDELDPEQKSEKLRAVSEDFITLMGELWEGMFEDDEPGIDDEAVEATKHLRKLFPKSFTKPQAREATKSALDALTGATALWRDEIGSALLKATKSSKVLSATNASTVKDAHSSVRDAKASLSEVESALEDLMDKAGINYKQVDDVADEYKEDNPLKALEAEALRFESLRFTHK